MPKGRKDRSPSVGEPDHTAPLTDLVPTPPAPQVLQGIADIIRKIQDLNASSAKQGDFATGRVHGLTQALSMIYGLPFSEVRKLMAPIDQPSDPWDRHHPRSTIPEGYN